jgi:hypothetical protein
MGMGVVRARRAGRRSQSSGRRGGWRRGRGQGPGPRGGFGQQGRRAQPGVGLRVSHARRCRHGPYSPPGTHPGCRRPPGQSCTSGTAHSPWRLWVGAGAPPVKARRAKRTRRKGRPSGGALLRDCIAAASAITGPYGFSVRRECNPHCSRRLGAGSPPEEQRPVVKDKVRVALRTGERANGVNSSLICS